MNIPLRVLIIEDSEDDTLLLIRRLRHGGFDPGFERVDKPVAMEAALAGKPWDLIIADYAMPHFSGLDALALLKRSGRDIPFIIVSGTIGEETAVAVMKAGAQDFIKKENLARLLPAIERELREAAERRARREAERSLREAEAEKKQFYREVVLAVTGGRLSLQERGEMAPPPADPALVTRGARDIGDARTCVRRRALAFGLTAERVDDLELAVGEAAANAWKHAGGGTVVVDEMDDTLRVYVVDHGKGIAPNQLARAAFEKGFSTTQTMGAGFSLMLNLVDRLRLITDTLGTTLILEMHRQAPRKPDPWESWQQLDAAVGA